MELFTHCPQCKTKHTEDTQWAASASDDRLPGQSATIGCCESCKAAYYQAERDVIRLAYQQYLDSFPTPGYVYGLFQGSAITYIGRTYRVDRRLVDHRRDARVFDEYCVLDTVAPGYMIVEMEARWICHALQQGWPLTNKETQPSYKVIHNIQQHPDRDYFTCTIRQLACGDKVTIKRVRSYERWVQDMPAEIPVRYAIFHID